MTLRVLATIGVLVVTAASIVGCGKLGDLERPSPIFGNSNADAGPEPSRSVRTVDPRDPNSDPAPSRTGPIDTTTTPGK